MPDIVIAGATFRNVPQIDIPKEGSGTASFVYEDGTKQITENGTGIDVSGYASVDVAVPSSQPVINPLSVTQNGEYTAPSGVDGYSPVTVNVSGGGGTDRLVLLKEQDVGTISYSSTSGGSTGKSVTFDHGKDYDLIVVEVTRTNRNTQSHISTISVILIDCDGGLLPNDRYRGAVQAQRLNLKTDNTVDKIGSAYAAQGIYPSGFSIDISDGTASFVLYARYSSTYTKTINGNYICRVYGINFFDIIKESSS